jgi:hypothetical protein
VRDAAPDAAEAGAAGDAARFRAGTEALRRHRLGELEASGALGHQTQCEDQSHSYQLKGFAQGWLKI